MSRTVLQVSELSKSFVLEKGLLVSLKNRFGGHQPEVLHALDSLSFSVYEGETLGILGESGSGKSTLARILMGIYQPDSGTANLAGRVIPGSNRAERLDILRNMQMIFQDPFASLDPRMTVRQIILEPLKIHGIKVPKDRDAFLAAALNEVGLDAGALDRYPTEFSGGQRQRIGICRALMLKPSLLVADEAVSALDVSVQAQILELLARLKNDRGLSMIFISHDVAVVRQISDRIILLYRGHLVEEIQSDQLLQKAAHPYSKKLLSAALYLREGNGSYEHAEVLACDKASEGCCYRSVCPEAFAACEKRPGLRQIGENHRVACWLNSN